mmetsp:Transcript_99356/g.285414  ORF Transcript_99356/g.285414 Transcript_99356/m.285414 type:complete len:356 (-) Transcript_99356:485-1552(-)
MADHLREVLLHQIQNPRDVARVRHDQHLLLLDDVAQLDQPLESFHLGVLVFDDLEMVLDGLQARQKGGVQPCLARVHPRGRPTTVRSRHELRGIAAEVGVDLTIIVSPQKHSGLQLALLLFPFGHSQIQYVPDQTPDPQRQIGRIPGQLLELREHVLDNVPVVGAEGVLVLDGRAHGGEDGAQQLELYLALLHVLLLQLLLTGLFRGRIPPALGDGLPLLAEQRLDPEHDAGARDQPAADEVSAELHDADHLLLVLRPAVAQLVVGEVRRDIGRRQDHGLEDGLALRPHAGLAVKLRPLLRNVLHELLTQVCVHLGVLVLSARRVENDRQQVFQNLFELAIRNLGAAARVGQRRE